MSDFEKEQFPFPTSIPAEDGIIQGPEQRRVEGVLLDLADSLSSRLGISRRRFLSTASGMAAAFLAMNAVHGSLFSVDPAEAADPKAAAERLRTLHNQFIFDVQTHFVSDRYTGTGLLGLRELAKEWNPEIKGRQTLESIRYENYVREVFRKSDTSVALLSSAPADNPASWFLHNPEIMAAREKINAAAGSRRLLAHAIFTPGQPGWLEKLDEAAAMKPDSWKGYTLGSPSGSKWPWRLDDEDLVYPAYDKMLKAQIPIVCIHKGLLPSRLRKTGTQWQYAGPGDIGGAAKAWPQLTFVIYHSAIRSGSPPTRKEAARFEKTGYIPWVSELAKIPGKWGVTNLYAELGSVFAVTAISNPRYCAGILGTLIKGFGHERVLWGTDSVWYGSPQWQIEALRRLEIPEDLRRRFGFRELGPADGPVKRAILGGNAARLYGIKAETASYGHDRIAAWKHREEGAAEARMAGY
ncbi:amidohydrolase family protein [Geobacter sp. DSM 9736]|uniref:amidohydrolase family protein n=1 Tax=Geobacter sp. DSM 9736 TaxID=1277350 RepID=UPI000B5E25A3|nr:amidohydrolase family protein [Geobacter sp. DSM 9736]SNB46515.1 hypothetical protein SAMN06269301_1983 [Geobacter sp. DSM 9736]